MKRFFKIICLVAISCWGFASNVSAQSSARGIVQGFLPFEANENESPEEDEIATDRDSFTPSTNVVGRKRLVMESGYSLIDNRQVAETHSLPEILSRYGINDLLELRLGVNYEIGGASNPISGNVPGDFEEEPVIEEEARLLYGTKMLLTDQRNWIPESSIIIQGFTPTSGEATATTFSSSYIFGWKLRNGSIWDSGIRYSTNSVEEDHFNVWSPSTVLKIPVGERWKAHAEYFGVFSEGREHESTQHFFSPGIHYLISQDLEVGTRVGWGLNEQSPNFFTNIGIGIRF